MFKRLKRFSGAVLLAGLPLVLAGLGTTAVMHEQAHAAQSDGQEAIKVIYHINDSQGQALSALRSMRNHKAHAPDTTITVVAHADGIDFLTNDYADADTVGPLIAGLAAQGVNFEVCEITMDRLGLDYDDFLLEADFTPSGVARIAELQAKENYAYIKP